MFKKREFEQYGGKRTIVVLCIDTSNSVFQYQKEINLAVRAFLDELEKAPEARYGTEVAIVTYNTSPHLHCDFTLNKSYIKNNPIVIPNINETGGWTDIGPALDYSISIAINKFMELKNENLPVYAPWIFLFTDGHPENRERTAEINMEKSIKNLQSYEYPQRHNDKIYYVGVGVGEDVNSSLMRRISAHGGARYIHTNSFSDLSKVFKFFGATTVIKQKEHYRIQPEIDNEINVLPVSDTDSFHGNVQDTSSEIYEGQSNINDFKSEFWFDNGASDDFNSDSIVERLDLLPSPPPEQEQKKVTINGTIVADPNIVESTNMTDVDAVFNNAKGNSII